jgi:hypothetical protein
MTKLNRMLLVLAAVALITAMFVPAAVAAVSFTAELPVLMHCAGQSGGIFTVEALMQRGKVPFDWSDIPKATDVASGVGLSTMKSKEEGGDGDAYVRLSSTAPKGTAYKTVVFVIGYSLKGMGASSLTMDTELDRINGVINYCVKNKIKMIGIHIEGQPMRGKPGSEFEQIIDAVAPKMNALIVEEQSNTDGKFTDIAKKSNIPLIVLPKATADKITVFKEVFGVK